VRDLVFAMVHVVVVGDREVAVGIFDELQSAFVVDVGSIGENGSSLQIPFHSLIDLGPVDETAKCFRVERRQSSLLL